jgi:pimeloyl-ACP methyl ester carboxylesterase
MTTVERAPVLLVHGWAGSFERTWQRSGLVVLLREAGRDVLPYDLPGHGSRAKSHDPADYASLHDDVIEYVSVAVRDSNSRVDVVGFSLGAITVLNALVRHPDRFGTVILAGIGDGVFLPHDPQRTERILSGLEGRAEPRDVVARVFGKIGNEPPNDAAALAAVLRRPRQAPIMREHVARVTNPVVIVLGDQDFSAPADALVAAFPNARLQLLPGIDHFRTPDAFGFIDVVLETLGVPPGATA